jgi:hypothetical protein
LDEEEESFPSPTALPPAYFASLRELRVNPRAISLNTGALVLLTMSPVAVFAHAVVPGMP